MSQPILLDTCALLWIAQGEPIDREAAAELDAAADRGEPLRLSPITWWEIGLLVARGRLPLTSPPERWLRTFQAAAGAVLDPLEPEVLIESTRLPGAPPRDPADCMIIAAARAGGYRLMTRDRRILAYARAGHVASIPC